MSCKSAPSGFIDANVFKETVFFLLVVRKYCRIKSTET